jgi:ABC-type transport system substrate-binding protein/class 3 adenylate cyclase
VTSGTDAPAEIRTFLIADVRGYTRFTQSRGDEAGAALAARFAQVVREVVEARDGRVVELRGDEALCVFTAPRSALRAAVDLQRRCAEEMRADPSLPLGVGIGIDAGEAVPVAGGYRGGALNLAARLCSVAKRGEVLISDGVVHLARRTDELTYVDRGRLEFKGFDAPVHVHQLQFDLDLPPEEPIPRERWTPVRVATVAVAGVVLLGALVAAAATLSSGPKHPDHLGTNVVGVLDRSGSILGSVRLDGTPAAIAAGAGSVWASLPDRDAIVRIDPKARIVVDTVPLQGARAPAGIAVGGGGVWVADSGSGQVSWINPQDTGAITPIRVGQGPGPIAYGAGAAWVVNTIDATVQRINENLQASRPVAVGGTPSAVTVGGGYVWVSDTGSSTVAKLDPKTMQIVSRSRVGNGPVGVAYGGGKLWVANADDGTVTRLDPSTQRGTPIPVGSRPSSVSYSDGTVWVPTANGVVRIDDALHTATTETGSKPTASVAGGGRIWVTAVAAPASHRGGTLTVAYASDFSPEDLGPFDPAVAPYAEHWQMLSMINDGLVTYRKAGGPAGLEVVPDLAVAMPTVTDGGRTYTFQLRKGLRYSDGRPVRASDFRSSLERALSPPALNIASGGYYAQIALGAIAGYSACNRRPEDCSLGIDSDDATGTITIHLTKPDPALPLKLAMPVAEVVAPGAPPPDSGKPVIGTGPYMISRLYDGGHRGVLLVRNPRFRQWSADAQPSGYPDRIRWVRFKDSDAALTAVERGRADVLVGRLPPERYRELSSRFATLAHPVASLTLQYVSLNTRVPPFNDVRARRAFNLAVDRRAMATAMGGAGAFVPTCQVLPPGIFGYAPYCPYTSGSTTSGTWAGPDLRKARGLVKAAGTSGDRVVVWGWGGSTSQPLMPLILRALDQIGYRASAHITSPDAEGYGEWNNAAADSNRRVSAVLTGWAADYPNPIDFLDLLLSCRSYVPGSIRNLNSAELCDSTLDGLIDRAEAVQVRDPARGAALWQAADRRAVDLAAWVPLLHDVSTDVVAGRVGNYQHNAEWSVLLDQLWVR